MDKVHSVTFRELTGDDKAQLSFLEALVERDGVAIINDAPRKMGTLRCKPPQYDTLLGAMLWTS
jgi:hypothetical protein